MNEQSPLLEAGVPEVYVRTENTHGAIDDQGECYVDGVATRQVCLVCGKWVCKAHRGTAIYYKPPERVSSLPFLKMWTQAAVVLDPCCNACDKHWERDPAYPKTELHKPLVSGCCIFLLVLVGFLWWVIANN